MSVMLVVGIGFAEAQDEAQPEVFVVSGDERQSAVFALDQSVRTYDAEGRLHVAVTPISKANVCPYFGHEIPDYEELGLDAEREYQLLRDPGELEKAAASFNNLPLLSQHVAVSANDHQPGLVVGSTGTDAHFDGQYLSNSLVVWAKDAIEVVNDGSQKELSSAYRYRADMTPGVFHSIKYDGVMRDIIGNHVALVEEGRAGADVVIGDSNSQGTINMPNKVLSRKAVMVAGALAAYLRPKLAADSNIDLTPVLEGVTVKNFNEKIPEITEAVTKGVKLAKDANIADLATMLTAISKCDVEEGADADPNSGLPMTKEQMVAQAPMQQDADPKRAFLQGKLSAEDMSAYDAFGEEDDENEKKAKAEDEEKDEKEDKDMKDKAKDGEAPEKKPMGVTKAAMDAAIEKTRKETRDEVIKTMRDTAEAREFVLPWVGKLSLALDSAQDVYKTALEALKVKTEGIHPTAFKAILEAQPQPGARQRTLTTIAADAGNLTGFASRFGKDAERIGLHG